jgi:hypothetical protein
MRERRLEGVVVGSGDPGLLKIALGRGRRQFIADVPIEYFPASVPRLPNSRFIAVVLGREFVRVASSDPTIEDQMRWVLNADWDPLGVADERDNEYDMYIGGIYLLLASDTPEHAIAAHLLSIEVEGMRLKGTPMNQLLEVAAKLRKLQLPLRVKQPQIVRSPDKSR